MVLFSFLKFCMVTRVYCILLITTRVLNFCYAMFGKALTTVTVAEFVSERNFPAVMTNIITNCAAKACSPNSRK